jgi:hypothetical protein
VANSVQMTPRYAQMLAQHKGAMAADDARANAYITGVIAEGGRVALREQAKRGQIAANTRAEIAQMQNDTFRNTMQSGDAQQRATVDTIRSVANFTVPGSNTVVQLPHYYQFAYTNGKGDFILTNNSLFNPNVEPAFNQNNRWDGMQRVD